MSRLIDADALIETIIQHGKNVKCGEPILNDLYQEAHKHIIDLVEIQPTAFDVEKVVAELGKIKGHYGYFGSEECEYVSYDNAIDIVKRGGVE